MKYYFSSDEGEVEIEIHSQDKKKTVFKVKNNGELLINSEEWVADVLEEAAATGLSLSRSFDNVSTIYTRKVKAAPNMYPGGVVYESPTAAEVENLLETMNEYREDDVKNNEEESPYYRETPFTLEDLIAEIDLCDTTRD